MKIYDTPDDIIMELTCTQEGITTATFVGEDLAGALGFLPDDPTPSAAARMMNDMPIIAIDSAAMDHLLWGRFLLAVIDSVLRAGLVSRKKRLVPNVYIFPFLRRTFIDLDAVDGMDGYMEEFDIEFLLNCGYGWQQRQCLIDIDSNGNLAGVALLAFSMPEV